MGRSRGPETGREEAGSRSRGLLEVAGGRHRAGGVRRGDWLGPDSRDGWRRTTKGSEMERQGGPRRHRQRWRLPSGLFPSQLPRVVLSPGVGPAKRTPPPASQPVRLLVCPLPATSQPARAGRAPTAPSAASPLPLPHFLLLSLCQTHLELFKPKYSAPSPSSQIPPQFKTSPALALSRGTGGEVGGWRRAGERGRLFISV